MKSVKIYGLKRTGTNFLTVLLEQNLNVKVMTNKPNWKHGMVKCKKPTIAMVRHPLDWLGAIYRYEKHKMPFERFAKQGTMISLWQFACSQYLSKANYIVMYEDAIKDQEKTVCEVADYFELDRRGDFVSIKNKVAPAEKITNKKHTPTNYREWYDDKMLEKIRGIIDSSLLDRFGYKI
jgi:hypothetical protein